MSDLRELRRAPEPFRTRPDEPEPIRVFDGWCNGERDPSRYRAHLVRFKWEENWGCWVSPDSCWGATLCDRDAYPRRWVGLNAHPMSGSHSYIPEVADMQLCAACARVLSERGAQ